MGIIHFTVLANGVLETPPFLFSEQLTEARIPQCHGLVRAHLLHPIDNAGCQLYTGDVLLQSCGGLFEIDLCPVPGCPAANVTANGIAGVWAGIRWRKRVVIASRLDDDLFVICCQVLRGTEESDGKVQ